MSTDLYFTADSFFLFSSATRVARWTELNHIRPHGRKWDLKMHEMWDIPSPTNQGPKNYHFPTISQLKATLMAYIFKMFGRILICLATGRPMERCNPAIGAYTWNSLRPLAMLWCKKLTPILISTILINNKMRKSIFESFTCFIT